jgi:undecaprenyl-phosphate 4-deoxy-4-formamido-L-arabinose transferase
MPELSVVVPVFNSEDCLEELHGQIEAALAGFDFEVIFVNDQSRDGSWAKIKSLSEESDKVIGIDLRKNSGQDNAIMAGLRSASGNYSVIIDDDLQHAPSDIPGLYGQCKQGYDICYGRFRHKKQALWKNFGSFLNGKVAEILLEKPRHIYLSPFQIIKKEVVDEIIKYEGPYPYVQGLLLNVTDNVTQVEIEHRERYRGRGNFSFLRSLAVFLKLATNFSVIPLRLATMIGFATSIAGFLLIPWYLYRFFFGEGVVEGWTTIIVLLLVIGGLILVSLGIIGEYLGRMHLNINGKPQYVIKERVGKKKAP